MYTLVTFATQWGSKYGGINSFNADFLTAFGFAYHLETQIVCIVAGDTPEAKEEASKAHVQLVPLPYIPEAKSFDNRHARAGLDQLNSLNISFEPDKTVWLGHDRITGQAATAAANMAGGRSAVIHHMSYDHYESYAEDSQTAQGKVQAQAELFEEADVVLAVGPLLRDAARDLIRGSKPVHVLIPGLAEIDSQDAPNTFVAFMSGRLTEDAARIKQGHLGVAAFAKAHRDAREQGRPEALRKQPKLLLRGVDFEGNLAHSSLPTKQDPEAELKQFAEDYASAVVNLHTLPFTEDRKVLYSELSRSSVALMPSWHEGFGLVGWEAIAAGVPLIVSKNSGVYSLLEDEYPGAGTGCVYPLDIRGAGAAPFFRGEDLQATVAALKEIADNPRKARKQASILRNMVGDYTWAACAGQAAHALGWELKKGSIPAVTSGTLSPPPENIVTAPLPSESQHGSLQLPAKQWRAGSGMADSQLLRAEEALLPFDLARQPDIDDLNAWLDDPQWPLAVRLITGAGGQGKTRLALELCNHRLGLGWHAGFLASDVEANRMSASWQTLRRINQPLLIVIDYAETRQTALLALLKSSLQNPSEKPVRVLLLARDAGEWWDNLPSRDSRCEPLLSGHATSGPFRLQALYAAEPDRLTAFDKALQAFARTLAVSTPRIVPDLHGEHFERPLYVQMAALLALYGERPTTAQGLTKALLNHERRYWQRLLAPFHWPEPERRAEQLLALATLAGGFATPRAAEPYWNRAKGTVLNPADFSALFRALATLYPGTQGLQALRPDLLGEALVAQSLLRPEDDSLLDAVLSNTATQTIRRNALTVLARLSPQRPDLHETIIEAFVRHFRHCCQDIAVVGTETTSHLPTLAEEAFSRLSFADKSQVAGLLASSLQEESVQLAGLNCRVSEYLVNKYRDNLKKKPGNADRMREYAQALDIYAVNLARLGRYSQASDIGLIGLNIYNQLLVKDPRRFEASYAGFLVNYANHLKDVGRYEEALEHSNQALLIYQRLVQKSPDRFEPDYALSLSNYANNLSEVGRYEEALDHTRQSLELRRRLAEKSPDRFEPDYASSLGNYANRLRDDGQYEEALEHARQSLELRRRLAEKSPDRFEPDYASSLSNYAIHLSDVGRYEEALEHARQSLELRQRLVQKSPDRFEPDYASLLGNYASNLSSVGRYEEALEYARQSLELRRRLAEKSPDRFESDYAWSLGSYSNRLSGVGRYEEALEHSNQALLIYQRLAEKSPDRFEPDYAWSLGNYANNLSSVGRYEEALEHARQSLELRQRLVQKSPDRFEPDYASSLGNYADNLSEVGRYEEALEHSNQALLIYQRLAEKSPDRFEPDYASLLGSYSNRLSDVGRYEEALEHSNQALLIYQRLAEKHPVRFAASLFLNTCSVHFQLWLCDQVKGEPQVDQNNILSLTPSHRRPLMLLLSAFVEACWAPDQASRTNAFQLVYSTWNDLSIANKTASKDCWLCAAAWYAGIGQRSLVETHWELDFQQYITQRNGRLPQWMLEVARRLEFQWPV